MSCAFARGQAPDYADVEYASVDGVSLTLDLYLPKNLAAPAPVIVWIHGGGWQQGSKTETHTQYVVEHGYAYVSIAYRLTPQAIFPAQLHDCKAAIRWVRAHAAEYRFDAGRIGVWGESAGGHLAALVGATMNLAEWEGSVGGNLRHSSAVRAVCSFYGPTNLVALCEALPNEHCAADTPEGKLIGGAIMNNLEKARAASPVTYVDGSEPPFLLVHGVADHLVPFQQSAELDALLRAKGAASTLVALPGAGHGGEAFDDASTHQRVVDFFKTHLQNLVVTPPDTSAGAAGSAMRLYQNFPNPVFRGREEGTSIRFALPQAETVRLRVFDLLGREVATLLHEPRRAGEHHFRFAPADWPSGAYVYQLEAGKTALRQKMSIVR